MFVDDTDSESEYENEIVDNEHRKNEENIIQHILYLANKYNALTSGFSFKMK
jgi:hypothetical protein